MWLDILIGITVYGNSYVCSVLGYLCIRQHNTLLRMIGHDVGVHVGIMSLAYVGELVVCTVVMVRLRLIDIPNVECFGD